MTEEKKNQKSFNDPDWTAGVDEAGRGPLAGPVVVAAVILGQGDWDQIDDSKRLSANKRQQAAELIKKQAVAWHIVAVTPQEIDQVNILQATMLGMSRSVAGLSKIPKHVLVDGNRLPELDQPATAIVGGDHLEKCIGAASILAKTHRDNYMCELAVQYPQYGFERHMGYPTAAHLAALKEFGPCPHHRCSFGPVKALTQGDLFKPRNLLADS